MRAGSLAAVRIAAETAAGDCALTTVVRPAAVPARPLAGLAELVPGAVVEGDAAGVRLTGVTLDSRSAQSGDLYAALPGATTHGAEFLDQALAAGAVAVLTDRPGPHPLPAVVVPDPRRHLGRIASWVYDAPSSSLDVVGVTGTNGKTTTVYLLEAGFAAAGRGTGLIGTVETRVLGESVPSVRTTPEAPDLHALLAVMRERGAQAVAMEVSSHGLALGRVDGVGFAVAVFTNLTQDHLDFHADMDAYFRAKASLFQPERCAIAVVNVDDEAGQRIAGATAVPLVTTSAQGRGVADWRATDVATAADGSRFRLHGPDVGRGRTVRLRLPGGYNVDNALGAIAALHAAGVDLDAAIGGVESLTGVPGRLERVDAGQPFLAVVDYAHSPDAVASVLRTVRPLTRGKVVVVLGCGGDRDRGKRPLMGEAAARGADVVVVTSDNPRSEDPLAIIAAVAAGARAAGQAEVVVQPDRAAAIRAACSMAAAGDVLVVAGKGHEQGQELADRTIPFDDRVELRRAIEGLGR